MPYKVVRNIDGELQSAAYWSKLKDHLKVCYKIKEWVSSEGGRLLVFETLEQSKKFITRELCYLDNVEIHKCRTKNSKRCKYLLSGRELYDERCVKDFWKNFDVKHIKYSNVHAPTGTLAVKEVMLTEKVWSHDESKMAQV